jgi:hypothetical protein
MEKEIWKDVIWYEWYKISNKWIVISNKQRIKWNGLKQHIWLWYKKVTLCKLWIKKTFSLHRLLAIHFINNDNNLPMINHIDWNKLNNNINNLEWCTAEHNTREAFRLWLNKSSDKNFFKTNHPFKWVFWGLSHTAKKVIQYDKITKFKINDFNSIIDASLITWINKKSISSCCVWRTKTWGWYIWSFK